MTNSASRFFFLIVIGILIAVSTFWGLGNWMINHDVAAKLYITQHKFLYGRELYTQFQEHNPPFQYIFFDLFFLFSRCIPFIKLEVLYSISISTFAAISTYIVYHCYRSRSTLRPQDDIALLVYYVLLIFVPGENFGQKEHLSLILMTPYLLGRFIDICDSEKDCGKMVMGILLAFALMIRPHFIIVVLAIEIFALGKSKRIIPTPKVTKGILIFLATYIFSTIYLYLTLTSNQLETFFSIVSQELQGSRSLFFSSYWHICRKFSPYMLIVVISLIIALAKKSQPLLFAILVSLSFYLSAILFKTDWSYRFIPFHIYSIFLIPIMLGNFPKLSIFFRKYRKNSLILIGIFATFIPIYALITGSDLPSIYHELDSAKKKAKYLIRVINEHSSPKSFVAFYTTTIQPKFPVLFLTHRRMDSPIMAFESLPNQYINELDRLKSGKFHSKSHMSAIEYYVYKTSLESLHQKKPDLIIIDRHNWPFLSLDLYQYFSFFKDFNDVFINYNRIEKDRNDLIILKRII